MNASAFLYNEVYYSLFIVKYKTNKNYSKLTFRFSATVASLYFAFIYLFIFIRHQLVSQILFLSIAVLNQRFQNQTWIIYFITNDTISFR